MFRTLLIGLLVASCNNPPPPPRESGPSHMIATPRGASPNPAIAQDRARVETRLQDRQTDIEAAFVAGDCDTIALRRATVEKPGSYNPPLAAELLDDETTVRHSRLDEYDRRARELGCELENCNSFTDITVKDSTSQIVSATTKDTQTACYRLRNTLGEQLLSVKVSARATKPGIGVYLETAYGGGAVDGETTTLGAYSITAFAVRSTQPSDDDKEPEGGWQAIPFTLTVTPVLRRAGQDRPPPRPPMVK